MLVKDDNISKKKQKKVEFFFKSTMQCTKLKV